MADKEERIYVGLIGKKQMLMPMTRKEAIEIMAEAMYYGTYDRKEFPVAFSAQYKGTQIYWKKTAELALNALLEGVKK